MVKRKEKIRYRNFLIRLFVRHPEMMRGSGNISMPNRGILRSWEMLRKDRLAILSKWMLIKICYSRPSLLREGGVIQQRAQNWLGFHVRTTQIYWKIGKRYWAISQQRYQDITKQLNQNSVPIPSGPISHHQAIKANSPLPHS